MRKNFLILPLLILIFHLIKKYNSHDVSEMKYIALSHAIYLSKISNTELILINIIEEIISSSTLLSFIRKEEER